VPFGRFASCGGRGWLGKAGEADDAATGGAAPDATGADGGGAIVLMGGRDSGLVRSTAEAAEACDGCATASALVETSLESSGAAGETEAPSGDISGGMVGVARSQRTGPCRSQLGLLGGRDAGPGRDLV